MRCDREHNKEKVDFSVAASAATRIAGGVEPLADCVEQPVFDRAVTGLTLVSAPRQQCKLSFYFMSGHSQQNEKRFGIKITIYFVIFKLYKRSDMNQCSFQKVRQNPV